MSAVSREIKLVVVGDDVSEIENKPGSGNSKTILLHTYIYKQYQTKHIPNHFHHHWAVNQAQLKLKRQEILQTN